MINRIAKYTLLSFFLIIIIAMSSLTFNAELRRFTLFRVIAVHDFYQLRSLLKYVEREDSIPQAKYTENGIKLGSFWMSCKSNYCVRIKCNIINLFGIQYMLYF